MRARFIGNGRDDPASVTLGGVTFALHGAPMAVSAEWERRVAGNGHFEVVAVEPGASAEDVSPNNEKAALLAQAEALGLDVDGRWGVKRLRAALEAAHGEDGA